MILRFGILLTTLLLMSSLTDAAEIAVKSTTNRGETNIGDYWIAEDFAEGFRKLGKDTLIDYRGEYHNGHTPKPRINLYMRGYTKFFPPFPDGIKVLYVYYPMAYSKQSGQKISKKQLNFRRKMPENAVLDDDWQNYDLAAVASPRYVKELNKAGIPAFYVPQFTNPNKFYPEVAEELQTDILFVGSNWHDRTSLRFALESGFKPAVYGYNWEGIVPKELYKASYIPNDMLHKYYSSAKIVLNDHRPDMKEAGFINNRIYDATASGTLVISDYMPEIEEAYHETIPMYKNKEELAKLLYYYLDPAHESERLDKARQAREITLKNFTDKAAAKLILEAADEFEKN